MRTSKDIVATPVDGRPSRSRRGVVLRPPAGPDAGARPACPNLNFPRPSDQGGGVGRRGGQAVGGLTRREVAGAVGSPLPTPKRPPWDVGFGVGTHPPNVAG